MPWSTYFVVLSSGFLHKGLKGLGAQGCAMDATWSPRGLGLALMRWDSAGGTALVGIDLVPDPKLVQSGGFTVLSD